MIRNRKRFWALLLSAALIVTQLPAVAMAENHTPEDGSIASFESLGSGVEKQDVTVGTGLSGLNLPDTVMANIYHVTEDMLILDEDNLEDDENLNEGELPLITVSMDNQAPFDAVVSMLPTQISAQIENETVPATGFITEEKLLLPAGRP